MPTVPVSREEGSGVFSGIAGNLRPGKKLLNISLDKKFLGALK
jgi:hypothetical protein